MDSETGIILNDEVTRIVVTRDISTDTLFTDGWLFKARSTKFLWPPAKPLYVCSCSSKINRLISPLYVDNYPAPGKRPLSSIAPTIITEDDGSFFLALGGSGGSLIFPSIVQTILNVDWGMDIRQAIERPRVRFDLLQILHGTDWV